MPGRREDDDDGDDGDGSDDHDDDSDGKDHNITMTPLAMMTGKDDMDNGDIWQ